MVGWFGVVVSLLACFLNTRLYYSLFELVQVISRRQGSVTLQEDNTKNTSYSPEGF